MNTDDFDLFPRGGESREQHAQRFEDAILAEDWFLHFQAHGASYRALGEALAEETDPDEIMILTQQRGESLVRGLGSCAISLWQDDVLAERQQFEADFGEQH